MTTKLTPPSKFGRVLMAIFAALLIPGIGLVLFGSVTAAAQTTESFDASGELPDGWKIDATRPGPRLPAWEVVQEPKAKSAPNVLTLTDTYGGTGQTYNLVWNTDISLKNGEIEVDVRANAGKEDQGGGPMWRVLDANNYYVARYNPLEGNFSLYVVKDGKRSKIATAGPLQIKAGEWFSIRVEQDGNHINAWLDGRWLINVDDDTLGDAGGVGFWTKADAETTFDNITVLNFDD